jgi:hypothetical protein
MTASEAHSARSVANQSSCNSKVGRDGGKDGASWAAAAVLVLEKLMGRNIMRGRQGWVKALEFHRRCNQTDAPRNATRKNQR